MNETLEEVKTWLGALADLRRAVEFFDKVKAGTQAEQIAVGQDHWDWLERAARRVAELSN